MPGSPLLLGIDSSTTASKAIVWDRDGNAIAEGRSDIELRNPAPGAWLQDARQWWSSTAEATRAALSALEGDAGNLAAVCVTHQRETSVVTDARGEPLHEALVWMDDRCQEQVGAAVARLGAERLHLVSGKPPCTTPSMYKLMYLLERERGLAGPDSRVLDVHAALVWRLTGRNVTSLASADPMGFVDMRAKRWSDELLQLAGLTSDQMPALVEPGAIVGPVTDEAARATGLPAGLPVVAGAGDGQCAGLGAGVVGPTRAYLNLGTAIVSGVLSRSYRTSRAFRTLYGAAPDTFFLETDLQGGTFTINWLIDRLLRSMSDSPKTRETLLAELEAGAAKLPPGADGLMLVPYWNGVMNPHWDDDASGLVVGWRGGHGPEHLHRALLEGIAFEQRLHTMGVEQATGTTIEELVVLGGGSKSDLWCQILADATSKRLVRAGSSEATSLGAAILAARAAGVHESLDDAVAAMTHTGDVFEPGRDGERYERLYTEVYSHLYEATREPMRRLSKIASER